MHNVYSFPVPEVDKPLAVGDLSRDLSSLRYLCADLGFGNARTRVSSKRREGEVAAGFVQ